MRGTIPSALMTTAVKHEYDRIPYLVAFENNSGVRDVYGGLAEITVLESYLLKPKDKPSDTVLVFMHPIGGGAYLPMINALARAGHHVIYCNSRFRGTDSALLMEKVVEEGTGTAVQLGGISVAGKTGTAQIGANGSNLTQPAFVAFAPADHPKVAIAVNVDISNGGFGGTVAAPIAKAVLQALLANGG